MKLIIGGYAQGRLAYACKNYSLTQQDVWDAAGAVPWQGQRIIYHVEALVTAWLHDGKCVQEEIRHRLTDWQDTHADIIIIAQEVGCGLVPVSPEERIWREKVGCMNQILAEHAETVEHVCCGLGMYLKKGC